MNFSAAATILVGQAGSLQADCQSALGDLQTRPPKRINRSKSVILEAGKEAQV
jgi:hypothetical protein